MDAGPSTGAAAAAPVERPNLDTFLTVLDIACGLEPCPLSLADKAALRATCAATRGVVNATLRSAKVPWEAIEFMKIFGFDNFCEWKLVSQITELHLEDAYGNDTPERVRRLGTPPLPPCRL